MKKIILFLAFLTIFTVQSFAFLYEVKILDKAEIQKLTNDQLVDLFQSAVIERKASETFHGKSGFTPKEYESYKQLLGLVIRIRQEMVTRDLTPPPLEEWLK